jgi:acyl carrier protein
MAASREEIYERVKDVLVEQLGVDEGEINGPPRSRTISTRTRSTSSS